MSHRPQMRSKQREVVAEMIRSAVPMADGGSGGSDSDAWKLLIYDACGRNIIAPLLKVKDLREMGVTLHLSIDKAREPVPGAPAIYFCAPTEANIARIADDCVQCLYQWVYVNFTSPVSRKLLEALAEQLSIGGKLSSVRHIRVFDRTLSYVATSNDSFTLMMPKVMQTLNSRNTTEAKMEECLAQISQGLTHAVLSTQSLPVVAYSKSGAAEVVAKQVAANLYEYLQDRSFSPTTSTAAGRPLLLVVDRTVDLSAALHHPFSYRGLLVDAMGMALNQVSAICEGKEKLLDIDPDLDVFFRENCTTEFGSVGANVEAALVSYKREVSQLSAEHSGVRESPLDDDSPDATNMSKMLANAPKLAEKKRSLDAHMTLAYRILQKIREHSLDGFHGVELGVMSSDGLDREHFATLMDGPCSLEDKQRMYLVAYLLGGEEDQAFLERFLPSVSRLSTTSSVTPPPGAAGDSALNTRSPVGGAKGGFPALHYVKQLRSWSMGTSVAGGGGATAASGGSSGWAFAQNLAKGIAASLKQGSQEGPELAITRLVDALLQDATSGSNPSSRSNAARTRCLESIAAVDPRTKLPVDVTDIRFSQVIVFIVGGGSVCELDNLKIWEAKHPRKSVTFGCTDMVRGADFLEELSLLGSE